jgi:RHS repeat-associated protein
MDGSVVRGLGVGVWRRRRSQLAQLGVLFENRAAPAEHHRCCRPWLTIVRETHQSRGVLCPFFADRRGDPEDGLVYLRTRLYDPSTGRFMQQDPLWGSLDQPCTLNRSTYAQANPTNKVDPSGLFTCSVSLGGSFSLPAGGGLSVGVGVGNKEGIGVLFAPQYGGNTTIGVSGCASVGTAQ